MIFRVKIKNIFYSVKKEISSSLNGVIHLSQFYNLQNWKLKILGQKNYKIKDLGGIARKIFEN